MTCRESPPTTDIREGCRHLIENIPNGVLVLFDADLRYRIVGPEVLPFSGRNAADMVGKRIDELFPESAVATLEPELRATIEGEPRSFDMDFEEEIHHIETRPVTIDDEPYGVLITQAVTEERELARDLERTNERLDQFASMVSHDLASPLQIARGRLDLYRETGDEEYLDGIENALERIDNLTTDLTMLAREGTDEGETGQVSLSAVAWDAWETIDTQSATLSVDEVEITGNEGQLRILLENLFRNAIGHGGSDVTVRVGSIEGGFYVEDTGDGIPPEDRQKVFEHGFTTGYGGSGVGLAIVQQVAKAHELDVSLSESPEGGARFEFRRPSG